MQKNKSNILSNISLLVVFTGIITVLIYLTISKDTFIIITGAIFFIVVTLNVSVIVNVNNRKLYLVDINVKELYLREKYNQLISKMDEISEEIANVLIDTLKNNPDDDGITALENIIEAKATEINSLALKVEDIIKKIKKINRFKNLRSYLYCLKTIS